MAVPDRSSSTVVILASNPRTLLGRLDSRRMPGGPPYCPAGWLRTNGERRGVAILTRIANIGWPGYFRRGNPAGWRRLPHCFLMAILHRMRASVPIAPATFFRTATIILIVATIAMVPPLVRATARPGADTSAPIRLNRGFQQPPSKCIVVPPADAP